MTMFFYSIIAIVGFISWVGEVQQNFILNYPVGDPRMIACRILLALTMIFAVPINIFPAVVSCLRLMHEGHCCCARRHSEPLGRVAGAPLLPGGCEKEKA